MCLLDLAVMKVLLYISLNRVFLGLKRPPAEVINSDAAIQKRATFQKSERIQKRTKRTSFEDLRKAFERELRASFYRIKPISIVIN